jgi:hypothetical protein
MAAPRAGAHTGTDYAARAAGFDCTSDTTAPERGFRFRGRLSGDRGWRIGLPDDLPSCVTAFQHRRRDVHRLSQALGLVIAAMIVMVQFAD